MRRERGQERIVIAVAGILALVGVALFLRGCPSQPVGLLTSGLTFGGLLLGLAAIGLLLRQCAPRRPVPERDLPTDRFGPA